MERHDVQGHQRPGRGGKWQLSTAQKLRREKIGILLLSSKLS